MAIVNRRCPRCDGELIRRGGKLYCADYPACKHAEPLPLDLQLRAAGAPELPLFAPPETKESETLMAAKTAAPAPPDLPPELAGWRWHVTMVRGSTFGALEPMYQLEEIMTPGKARGYGTKGYARPDKAIAEAKRYVLSQPKPKKEAAMTTPHLSIEAAAETLGRYGYTVKKHGARWLAAFGAESPKVFATDVGVTLDSLAGIPEQDQAIAAVEDFVANPTGWLTFVGQYGVGKTLLVYAALNHLAELGQYGCYLTAPDLVDQLRGLIREGGDPDARLQRWIDAPLLAVDELDKFDQTEFAEKSIFRLFHARYQAWQTCGTLISYNLDREHRIPPFLLSRTRDSRFRRIVLAGADLRPIADQLNPWDRGEGELG